MTSKYIFTKKVFSKLFPSAGECSTITGSKPICFLYGFIPGQRGQVKNIEDRKSSSCVNSYLKQKKKQVAILCDFTVSPREMKPLLSGDILLYDAGVEQFDGINIGGRLYTADLAKQREDLVKWITDGGVLLTHEKMFRGCEAEAVIYLARGWGGVAGDQRRSGFTRAVSDLCLVTDDLGIKQDELRKYFNVVNV